MSAGGLTAALSEDERGAAALAALGLSPARLRRLLDGWEPAAAWAAVEDGSHPEDGDGVLRRAARPELAEDVARRCAALGLSVLVRGRPGYPDRLVGDSEAPAVLFAAGDASVLDGAPAVAVVGTRSASVTGRRVAAAVGEELRAGGVCVVSGLALGIDVAAHEGALRGAGMAPAAVLGSPHGAVMAPEQRDVHDRLVACGVVLSEQAPGTTGARWRFATRNRIMAALARLVVVVEAHVSGGAWHTVRAARARGVPVAAVPGSVTNPAAAGANALLAAGAPCVRHGGDVLALLGLPGPAPRAPAPEGAAKTLRPHARTVLKAFGGDAVTVEDLVRSTGLGLATVALALEQLSAAGVVEGAGGWWVPVPPGRARGPVLH